MDEDVKVGDIVYWYSEHHFLREYIFGRYPYFKEGYGVAVRVDSHGISIKYPREDRVFSHNHRNVHKVIME